MKLKLLALLLAAVAPALAVTGLEASAQSYDLKIEVSGLHNYKGQVVLALWKETDEKLKFPDQTIVARRDEQADQSVCNFAEATICVRKVGQLQTLSAYYTFRSLPAGQYAIFAFHDENNNAILDTGLFKRPLEGRGFSRTLPGDVSAVRSNITFDRAQFALEGDKSLSIGLRYPPLF